MGALDWMEWFGLKVAPEGHREATNCPCPACECRRAHWAVWTAVGAAFRTIAYWKYLHWQVREDRKDWPTLTSPIRGA